MKKLPRSSKLILCLVLFAANLTACGPPEEVTETFTETEFIEESYICQDTGLNVDLQPGKVVCSGDLEGQTVVIELVFEIVGDNARLQINKFIADGDELASAEYAELNNQLSREQLEPDEGYAITSVSVTDTEMTITENLK